MSKLTLGRVVATPGALAALEVNGDGAWRYLVRHANGDWGDVSPDDARCNDREAAWGRALSSYRLRDGTKLWVSTSPGDESNDTCVLLPSEW